MRVGAVQHHPRVTMSAHAWRVRQMPRMPSRWLLRPLIRSVWP